MPSINQPSPYDATIGPNGDYSDIQAAIDAGHTNLLMIGDVTEDSNIAVPGIGKGGLLLNLNGYKLDMSTYQFTFDNIQPCVVIGDGFNSEIEYAYTVATTELFDDAGNGATLVLKNLLIDNNSITSDSEVARSTVIQKFTDVRVDFPNLDRTGIHSAAVGSFFKNIEFVGGGNIANNWFDLDEGLLSNIYITCTSAGSIGSLDVGPDAACINLLEDAPSGPIVWVNGAQANWLGLNNLYYFNGGSARSVHANIKAPIFLHFQSSNMGGANLHTDAQFNATGNEIHISNLYVGTTMTISNADIIHTFTNCHFVGNVTISSGSTDHIFINCNFEGTVDVTGNDCTFVGCKVGADAGGGVNTITIQAAANRTIVSSCRTDAAISDSGTGSVLSANVVY